MARGRKLKQGQLSKASITVYRSRARHGDTKAQELLKAHSLSYKHTTETRGRKVKSFEDLKKPSQIKSARSIVERVKQAKSVKFVHGYESKLFPSTHSDIIDAETALQRLREGKARKSDLKMLEYLRSQERYKNPIGFAFDRFVNEIVIETKEAQDLLDKAKQKLKSNPDLMTEFVKSKYYVLTREDRNARLDSDAVRRSINENKKVDFQLMRLLDFLGIDYKTI